jgi:hypothetical protein
MDFIWIPLQANKLCIYKSENYGTRGMARWLECLPGIQKDLA